MVLDAVSDGIELTSGEGRRADVYGDILHEFNWNQIFLFLVPVLACSFVTGIISIPQRRIGQRTGFKNLFGMQKIKERRKRIGN